MSEAMSSVEIEDVVSSIRRLVSEDLRPAPRLTAVLKSDDKLLLTPALRVVADAPPPVPMPAAEPVAKPLPRLHLGADPVMEEVVATLERAVGAQDVEWESETGDPAPMVAALEWGEGGWVTVEPEQAELVDGWAQTDPDQDSTADFEDAAHTATDAGLPEPAPSQPMPPHPADYHPADYHPADYHPADYQPADYQPAHDQPASTDPEWADAAEAEVIAQLAEPSPAETSDQAQVEPAPMTFDEEVLRDLVRDLIQEELQGALGERITRNVRKLVRAEISRALAAREFE